MKDEILYMLGVVAVGFAVTYALRALPFLLFAGRSRSLPPWVERFGNLISPVIIAGLVVYAYSGLAWRTAWPYLAGALTVGLQLWKRNPLVSIVAGTLLYMTLIATCGCTTYRTLELDAKNPAVRVSTKGVLFGDAYVAPARVPELLADYDVPRDRVIHILLDPDVRDLRPARFLMACLRKGGYTRPVLVTARHAESFVTEKKPKAASSRRVSPAPAKKTIRYKGANE